VTVTGSGRERDDACPGALRPHRAADGALLRIRVPGGVLPVSALRGLAAASADRADGRIGVTSRGNVQLRGVRDGDVEALVERVREAGLLPQAEHERVRNIIASPLSGRRSASLDDVDPLVHDLDAALCARPGLARLPGRFLFAIDDGSGDVQGESADVVAVALGAGQYAVRPAGASIGLQVGVADVVAAVLAVAEAFLTERDVQESRAWRVAEVTGGGARLVDHLVAAGWPIETHRNEAEAANMDSRTAVDDSTNLAPRTNLEPGLIEQTDGRFALCALTPLGLLESAQVAALAAAAEMSDTALRITPWRRVVIRDLELPAALAARELLAAHGLVVAPGTAWSRLTACAGRPGCAKSLTDVHADARAFVARADPVGPALHWAGCERGCGTPAGPDVVRVLATADGYRVEGRLGAQDRIEVLA
jgi:precorrin-3B synthase